MPIGEVVEGNLHCPKSSANSVVIQSTTASVDAPTAARQPSASAALELMPRQVASKTITHFETAKVLRRYVERRVSMDGGWTARKRR
jgi:hypothetical protein